MVWLISLCCLLSTIVFNSEAVLIEEVNTNVIVKGLTQNLEVLCRFVRDTVTKIETLQSLELYYASKLNKSDIRAVASIDPAGNIKSAIGDDVLVSGSLNQSSEPRLKVTFQNVKSNREGVYQCRANGLSILGKPLTSTQEEIVKNTALTLDILAQELVTVINAVQFNKNNMIKARNTYFYISDIFRGRRYYLAKYLIDFRMEEAQATCQMFGGFMAETRTPEEFNFLRDFVKSYDANTKYDAIYVGIIDVGKDKSNERRWVGMDSGAPMTNVMWGPGQPNSINEKCLMMWRPQDWLINDWVCFHNEASRKSYICEITEY